MKGVLCNKVKARIECDECGYPYSEAAYPDDYDSPLACDASEETILEHIEHVTRLRSDGSAHPWDCKCLIHR